MPRLIAITETCKPEYRPFFLRQFASFASIVRLHLKPYMKRIFELIAVSLAIFKRLRKCDSIEHVMRLLQKAWYWRDDPAFRAVVINVLEEVGKAFGSDFSPYITDLCPYLLTVVQADQAKDKALTSQVTATGTSVLKACLGIAMRQINCGVTRCPHSLDSADDSRCNGRQAGTGEGSSTRRGHRCRIGELPPSCGTSSDYNAQLATLHRH